LVFAYLDLFFEVMDVQQKNQPKKLPDALTPRTEASSSFLNAIIKTAETHAYKVGEMSLCAPFLAFDPATWYPMLGSG